MQHNIEPDYDFLEIMWDLQAKELVLSLKSGGYHKEAAIVEDLHTNHNPHAVSMGLVFVKLMRQDLISENVTNQLGNQINNAYKILLICEELEQKGLLTKSSLGIILGCPANLIEEAFKAINQNPVLDAVRLDTIFKQLQYKELLSSRGLFARVQPEHVDIVAQYLECLPTNKLG